MIEKFRKTRIEKENDEKKKRRVLAAKSNNSISI
jgi:hypothetical protein